MARAIFRLRLPDGTTRLATGTTDGGPTDLLAPGVTVESLLLAGVSAVADAARTATDVPIPEDAILLAPIDTQEVWGAGVTYERSRVARMEEAVEPSIYDRVYDAVRPEVFFKSVGWRVRGPAESITVRADSGWNAPEPEFALVLTPDLEIAGYAIGNDVSSREIEGENPLYLPQAKVYERSCAIGPVAVPAWAVDPTSLGVRLTIVRDGAEVFAGETSVGEIVRPLESLTEHLVRAYPLPVGAWLLTGTGIVPPADFTLAPGDDVAVAIDGLGVLSNRVRLVGRAGPAAPRG